MNDVVQKTVSWYKGKDFEYRGIELGFVSEHETYCFFSGQKTTFHSKPNLTVTKATELSRKVFSKTVFNPNGKKTIALRGRGYLFPKDFCAENKVVSLDNFVAPRFFGYAGYCRKAKTLFEGELRYCLSDCLSDYLELVPFLVRDWGNFLFLIDELNDFFDKNKIDEVVVWCDATPFERILVLVAKQRGIPTTVYQHGLGLLEIQDYGWCRGFIPVVADKIVVWNDYFKKVLLDNGVEEKRIVVKEKIFPVAPHFDWSKYGVRPGEKLVLFIGQGSVEIESFVNAISYLSGFPVKIAFKQHPADFRKIPSLLKEKSIVVPKNADCLSLFGRADFVVGDSSTVLYDALLLKKKVVVFGGNSIHNNISSYLVSIGAYNAKNVFELASFLGVKE